MSFEEWLWDKYILGGDDTVAKFAKKFMIGDFGKNWPISVESLGQLHDYIDSLEHVNEDTKLSYKFAAKIAWNDYQKEIKQ